uniref:Uncharacterized protein n=1 Tax=Hemiselmis tepida TaxID=464990 RepID=A0A7S0VZA3_9CRYP|mmetsp:Transcript_22505/g.56805  ORF Transcript_22505/g.56805 Transcript_22505/m.56805 type:complete len:101 (+) Transcript_22505:51-353(+)|eukprot:CAMPEP_0174931660 /NCGR_PEP_ID=MMETSP1355-20121228/34402_1 /TAXON_ID=464990 /ORGANISM="Hemiselmis tepida, Strain CCMP443" /LENGTH=100 /DNA_ID=CAMNT_0016178031 /DNA_START=25 /DNA_END=327 /DNA_ORIENTATION=-
MASALLANARARFAAAALSAGALSYAAADYTYRSASRPTAQSRPVALEAAHDEKHLGSDHCDCAPLWECMSAKCNGESCAACAPLEMQLRACLAKSHKVA